MARRGDNLFLVVALGLGVVAWLLLRPRATGGPNATSQTGAIGGGVPGSPNQVLSSAGAQEAARQIAALGL